MGKWEIKDSILILKMEDGQVIIPTASDIYSVVFKGAKSFAAYSNIKVGDPKDDLKNIRFSRFGVEVNGHISVDSSRHIKLSFMANKAGDMKEIAFTDKGIIDHVFLGNTWYSIAHEADSIALILKEAGLRGPSWLDLSEYLGFKKVLQRHDWFNCEDSVSTDLKEKDANQPEVTVPPMFVGQLYPYQQKGYEWLKFMTDEGCGGILGDEMGLGKTVQIIAVLASRCETKETPSLVVAPVSLIENWRREILKFAPDLSVLVHRGTSRTGFYKNMLEFDVVLSSYDTVVSDLSIMKMIKWDFVVLDEAQNIKTPDIKRTRGIKQLPRNCAVAVTGTPFENHMTDLWSIADFVFPGYLGSLSEYLEMVPDEVEGARKVEPLLTPIMLRRRVSEVAKDLPDRIDIPQVITMDEAGAQAYEKIRTEIIEEYGKGAKLVMLIKLRMFCTHPFIVDGRRGDPALISVKYQRLCEIVEEIVLHQDKFIVFTTFNKMNDILVQDLKNRFGISVWSITGKIKVNERQVIIDEFSRLEGPAALILNPRAAGVGLNITAASHVIHYNPEWNPAVEDQASARAYRRGQTKNVTVHKLFYADTVEEVINERIEKKRNIFETAVIGTDGETTRVEDIIRAINITPLRS